MSRDEIAEDPNTSIETLAKLSKDMDKYIKIKVTCNPNTTAAILKDLSQDSDVDIRKYVAYNDNCPIEVLEQLSKDLIWYVKKPGETDYTETSKMPFDLTKELVYNKKNVDMFKNKGEGNLNEFL